MLHILTFEEYIHKFNTNLELCMMCFKTAMSLFIGESVRKQFVELTIDKNTMKTYN